VIVIQSYVQGLSGVHAANSEVELRIGHDAALPDEPVLLVEYPQPTDDPAGRDVWCDAENADRTTASAISFQVKPLNPERLSVSFFDRNRVVYTTWIDLQGGVWQPVRILFNELHPNPYFQPPGAKIGAPLDLGEIKGIAFAPHNQGSGQLVVSRFVLTR
jgi:Carbohydrate binding domain (family 11)